jgi:hypothetical protein
MLQAANDNKRMKLILNQHSGINFVPESKNLIRYL